MVMIKDKTMRRKIPVFKVNIEQGANYSQMAEIPELKQVIMEETIFAIADGMSTNKKVISLFEVAESNYYIQLDKNNWKPALSTALEYYIEKEDWKKCIECRDLIKKL
jgi:hypothetical protein